LVPLILAHVAGGFYGRELEYKKFYFAIRFSRDWTGGPGTWRKDDAVSKKKLGREGLVSE